MARKVFLLVFLGLFAANLFAIDNSETSAAQNDKQGYVLLDRLVGMFQKMAATGTGGREKVEPALEGIMADAKKAYSEKQIDPVFFRSFNRLLMVIKLTIIEDNEGILGPLIEQEVGEFVADVKGIKIDVTGKKSIGFVADAIAQGILNLHIYLDTEKEREKLMQELEKKLEAEAKKVKKEKMNCE